MIDQKASKANFLQWASTPQFTALAKQREGLPILTIILGVILIIIGLIWSDFVSGLGVICIVIGAVRRAIAKSSPPKVMNSLQDYEIVPCSIIIANSEALATPNSQAPAAIVGGFESHAAGYLEVTAEITEGFGEVYGQTPESVPAPFKDACQLINDDTYHEGRRRPVPVNHARGHELFLFDSILQSSYFESGQIDHPVAYVAASRTGGPIFHVPFALIIQDPEALEAAEDYEPNIIEHEMPEEQGYVAPAESVALPVVEKQIETHFGTAGQVYHEIISEVIHIDVHMVPGSAERPWTTLITSGMGDLAMTTPPEVAEFSRAELVLRLPNDWPLDQESFSKEENYWPIRTLKTFARLPHQLKTWFGIGHTIPFEVAGFDGIILAPPVWAPETFAIAQFPDGSPLHFLSMIPLYQSELDFKLAHGADPLFEKLWNSSHWDLAQPGRPAVF